MSIHADRRASSDHVASSPRAGRRAAGTPSHGVGPGGGSERASTGGVRSTRSRGIAGIAEIAEIAAIETRQPVAARPPAARPPAARRPMARRLAGHLLVAVLAMLVVAPRATAQPVLRFDALEYDFGPVWDFETYRYAFTFSNDGDAPLVIRAIRPSCGCTTTELDRMTFEPGDGDGIELEFKPKGRGQQTKTVTIVSNAGAPITLKIHAQVLSPLRAEPTVLRFGQMELGRPRAMRVRLDSLDPSFEVTSIQIAPSARRWLSARMVPSRAAPAEGGGEAATAGERATDDDQAGRTNGDANGGTASFAAGATQSDASPNRRASVVRTFEPEEGMHPVAELQVVISGRAPWGGAFGSVTVRGTGRLPGAEETQEFEATITVSAQIYGEIVPSDHMVRVSAVRPNRAIRRVITIRSASGNPLPLTSARLDNPTFPDMQVSLEPIPGERLTAWHLVFTGNPGAYTGRVGGTVTLLSDVPGEERLTFTVAGMVRE